MSDYFENLHTKIRHLEEKNERLERELKMANAAIEGHVAQKDELRAACAEKQEIVDGDKEVIRLLRKCCTQRGARMQIMREWLQVPYVGMSTTPFDTFLEDRPEAEGWFDEDGVPVP